MPDLKRRSHLLKWAGLRGWSLQVLIHAGTGGVGLSAIQVAKAMGAQVVATAGSTAKRSLLREMGVPEVVGSRDTEFVSTLASKGRALQILVLLNRIIVYISPPEISNIAEKFHCSIAVVLI